MREALAEMVADGCAGGETDGACLCYSCRARTALLAVADEEARTAGPFYIRLAAGESVLHDFRPEWGDPQWWEKGYRSVYGQQGKPYAFATAAEADAFAREHAIEQEYRVVYEVPAVPRRYVDVRVRP